MFKLPSACINYAVENVLFLLVQTHFFVLFSFPVPVRTGQRSEDKFSVPWFGGLWDFTFLGGHPHFPT